MREEHSWIKDIIPVTKTVGLCSAAILSVTAPLGSGNWVSIISAHTNPSDHVSICCRIYFVVNRHK